MMSEKFYQALADQARCAQDTGAPFLSGIAWDGRFCVPGHAALVAIFGRLSAHAAPPNCALEFGDCGTPMRVPLTCGLNVLRIQMVISVSAASGSTCG